MLNMELKIKGRGFKDIDRTLAQLSSRIQARVCAPAWYAAAQAGVPFVVASLPLRNRTGALRSSIRAEYTAWPVGTSRQGRRKIPRGSARISANVTGLWAERGTAERYTRTGAYRGRMTATHFMENGIKRGRTTMLRVAAAAMRASISLLKRQGII